MRDLIFDIQQATHWFAHERETPYVLVRVSEAHAATWAAALGIAVRRCYVSDEIMNTRARELGKPKSAILGSKLPDAGPIMSGDFGEILVYFYQAASEQPRRAFGPKKWRLKEARTKTAPYADVVQFILPSWPTASANDEILCAEVKAKATSHDSAPISSAIEGCAKDRTSRLSKTLNWLRDRAHGENLGCVEIAHLERFINAIDHPVAKRLFRAVAVICSSFVEDELRKDAPTEANNDYSVIIISVPHLKDIYTSVFASVRATVNNEENVVMEPE